MFKSTKATIIISCCLIFFMTLFISIGYATLTDNLQITGTAQYTEPSLIYIKDIRIIEDQTSNVTGTPVATKVGPFLLTVQHGNFSLNKQTTSGGQTTPGGSITMEITVRNNSGLKQYFAGYVTDPALSSTTVKVTYSSIALRQVVNQGEDVTFRVTIQNSSSRNNLSFNGRTGVVKFTADYGSITETVTNGVAEKFGEILNGKVSVEYKNRTYTGNQIVNDLIMRNASDSPTGNYIGNVGNASSVQKDVMEAIFGEDLIMDIGNTSYQIWFLIKRQEIDGKNSNNTANHDMVLYITADPLDQGGPSNNYHYVPVYAIVYTYNNNNTGDRYTQCEHLFAGEAPVCDWGGNFGNNNKGNFHTHYWRSTEDAYKNIKDNDTGNNQDGALDEVYAEYIKTQN